MSIPFTPEINLPINAEYYKPRVFFISNIVTGQTTLITTSTDHNYVIGQQVRVHIPKPYGSWQISGQQGNVISIPMPDQVVVTIDSSQASPFVPSPPWATTLPQIVPIGDVNTGAINTGRSNNQTYINGSFINISPQ